jgi:hypothetical protein
MSDARHPQPPHPTLHPQSPQVHPAPPRPVISPPGAAAARPGIAPMPTMKPQNDELDPIELVDEEEPTPSTSSLPPMPVAKKIKAFGVDDHRHHHDYKRTPIVTGKGACRVRSFHGKYSDQGLEYLDNAINDWLDSHPEIEVKFVTSTVMTFEGKIREPALVLNVWF